MIRDDDYSQMSDADLSRSFSEWLEEYREWIGKRIELNDTWSEEAHYLIYVRQQLYLILREMTSRHTKLDNHKLKELDKQWQNWILNSSSNDLKIYNPRKDVPRTHWWAWIDELNELSQQELDSI